MQKILLILILQIYRARSKFVRYKKKRSPKSVLFLPAFFKENAGYHWRVEKWAEILAKEGFEVNILSAVNEQEFNNYLQTNSPTFHIKYLIRRFRHVLKSREYETVIVRRELLLYNDYGNLFLEKLLLRIHPNVILDFDDDIAFAKKEPRHVNSLYGKLAGENGNKFTNSLSIYNRFIVPSAYLSNYILERNSFLDKNTICIIPTCIDYDQFPIKKYSKKEQIVFGWIGGNHNQKLIDIVIPALNEISKIHNIKLFVISGSPYTHPKAEFDIENKKWSLENEVEDLRRIDIGLMPLNNTNEDKGKAGFKLIQYMGLGIVSIASDVTINSEIIPNEDFGFKVSHDEEWTDKMKLVIEQNDVFSTIGSNARKQVIEHYSFTGNKDKFVQFIRN